MMGQINNHHEAIYISPDDDLTTICTRIEQVAAKDIVLVIPHHNLLKASGAWYTLYLHARRYAKHIQVISDSAYVRSIARSVRFKSAKSLDELRAEKPTYTRPTQHFSPSSITRRRPDTVEGINFLFANDDVELELPRQSFPRSDVNETPLSFLFDEGEDLPSLRAEEQIKPQPTPIRLSRPPKPVDIGFGGRVRPEPRLPWDDDDVPGPQPPKFVRRRTNPLVRSLQQGSIRKIRYRRPEPLRLVEVVPVVLVALFLIVRAIVRYMRSRG